MDRLESLVSGMEEDKLPLDDLLVRYEEGIRLVKFCSEKLSAAEQRIEIITQDAAGNPQLAPLDGDESEAEEAPGSEPTGVSLF